MKKINIFFTLFCLIGLSTGCKLILQKMYGIHQPKIMNAQKVLDFFEKRSVTSYNYSLAFANLDGYTNAGNRRFPDAFFFNTTGHYIEYRATPKSCNANVELFIDKLTSTTVIPDTSRTLAKLLKGTFELKTLKPLSIENLDNYDYYIVITWAEYIGKLNKDKSFDWLTHIEKAKKKGIKICTIFLSYDFFDFWNINPKDVPVVKIGF
jgi:hypothetical protein